MPELPEVQTTVNGLNKTVKGHKILDVWTSYKSAHPVGKQASNGAGKMHSQTIKNSVFYKDFKKRVVGRKILGAERRAKNILINLSGGETILVHMKMTGHLLYGKYKKSGDSWKPVDDKYLQDPFNQYVRLLLVLDNGKHLALSDMRKFAKVTVVDTQRLNDSTHVSHLGPEPLEKSFTFNVFKTQICKRPRGKIKTVLMDQTLISGIGNIYSDEILWRAGVHPLSQVEKIPLVNMKRMYKAAKETLKSGIAFGGDSMSDYRNIYGKPGHFQEHHRAYRRTGKKCSKDKGIIKRLVVGGRSAHFCPIHQTLYS